MYYFYCKTYMHMRIDMRIDMRNRMILKPITFLDELSTMHVFMKHVIK